jgi:hypothetical protein
LKIFNEKTVFAAILNSTAILNFYAWQFFFNFWQWTISQKTINNHSFNLILGLADKMIGQTTNLTAITWGHAVNTQQLLKDALNS